MNDPKTQFATPAMVDANLMTSVHEGRSPLVTFGRHRAEFERKRSAGRQPRPRVPQTAHGARRGAR